MLGVIFHMKHQSSVNRIGNFGPSYFYCLFAPLLPLVLGFYSAAMLDQRILENKCVGLSPVAVHAITKNFRGGGRHFIPKLAGTRASRGPR